MRKAFLNEHPEKIEHAVKLIGTTPNFRTVDPDLLREIFHKAWIFELGSAEHLIREKNKSDRMVYILLEGEFDVYAGKKFILQYDQPGVFIGEMAVIRPNTPRSADVIASRPSKVIAIESGFLDKGDPQNQRLANTFFKIFSIVLSEKVDKTTERAKLYENAVLEKEEISKYNKELSEVSIDLKNELQQKLAQIKLFSQVVESNLDAIITSDDKGNLQSGNHAFLSLFRYSGEEIQQLKLKALFDKLIADDSDYASMFSTGWKGKKTAYRKDKTTFPALISVSPIKTVVGGDKQEKVVFATVVRDITIQAQYEERILKANEELQQTYQELENTLQELEKSNQVKDQFFSNMSSQLKTPLDSMINYAELIKKDESLPADNVPSTDFLIQIVEEGKKMEKLVGNLLTMAELTSGLDLSLKIIRFQNFVDELKKQTKDTVSLVLEVDSQISVIIADKDKLLQAFDEILDYLVDQKHRGTEIHIQCGQNTEKKLLEIDITAGDPEAFATRFNIDEMDPLADGVELTLQKGELFLPLAKRIIDLHQGEMRITAKGESERISLTLPIDPNADSSARIKVVIIDEHEWDRRILRGIIEKQFVLNEVYEFDTQIAALNALNALKPNLVIVDPSFTDPQWSYGQFLSKLIEGNRDKISTLVISDRTTDLDFRNTIISLGITDFFNKPFTIEDALFKINSIIETKQKLYLLSNNIQKAEKTAATDGMTGLYNRKYFDNFVKDQFIKAELQDGHCSLIMMDVDNFKHYNDTNGHQMGDDVLIKIANILKDNVRQSDMAARYGGEEFVVVLPGTAKKMAENIAEKLRATIEKASFENEEKQPKGKLTASFGVSSFPENGNVPEIVLKGADHCLYLAKERGRNTVVGAEGIVEL
ncbi:MAG: diguanylate cyclase [Proteobacteria bacterium]|nr:diguanylate cyclase [Pseudomonadota bacterium]